MLVVAQLNPVHKLLGNFSASLGIFSNFGLVEQLLVHRATFKFLCLDSESHASATSETLKKCRILLVSRVYFSNLLVLLRDAGKKVGQGGK